MIFKKNCKHEYAVIRKKKCLCRKCVLCGKKIKYGAVRKESIDAGN